MSASLIGRRAYRRGGALRPRRDLRARLLLGPDRGDPHRQEGVQDGRDYIAHGRHDRAPHVGNGALASAEEAGEPRPRRRTRAPRARRVSSVQGAVGGEIEISLRCRRAAMSAPGRWSRSARGRGAHTSKIASQVQRPFVLGGCDRLRRLVSHGVASHRKCGRGVRLVARLVRVGAPDVVPTLEPISLSAYAGSVARPMYAEFAQRSREPHKNTP